MACSGSLPAAEDVANRKLTWFTAKNSARAAFGKTGRGGHREQAIKCLVPGGRSVRHELIAPVALCIQQGGEIAMVDPGRRSRSHRRLGVIGDAEAGGLDHAE